MKFLIILAILAYVLYKIGSFFYRAGAVNQHLRNFQDQQRKATQKPDAPPSKKTKVNGGEYIDYEEVK
jgi:hypothetical protein